VHVREQRPRGCQPNMAHSSQFMRRIIHLQEFGVKNVRSDLMPVNQGHQQNPHPLAIEENLDLRSRCVLLRSPAKVDAPGRTWTCIPPVQNRVPYPFRLRAHRPAFLLLRQQCAWHPFPCLLRTLRKNFRAVENCRRQATVPWVAKNDSRAASYSTRIAELTIRLRDKGALWNHGRS
jgi:hypothetical protein